MLCPPPFGMQADLIVKKILAENYIGRPHHVRLQSFTGNYLDSDAPAHWRQKIEISGLNTLTLGIYVEVLQRWLGDITGVFARGKIIHPMREGYDVIIPDLLSVLCSFENGAEGVLEFSGINALASGDRLEIYGSAGALTCDFTSDVVQAGKIGDRAMRSVEYDTVSDQYPRFLRDEIMPLLYAKYNIRKDAYSRAIAGNSSGGICANQVSASKNRHDCIAALFNISAPAFFPVY